MRSLFRSWALLLIAAQITGCASAPSSAAAGRSKNTYVIVHGAWGGGWTFKEVDDLLTAQGNKVYRPTLTGLGERSHLASPDIDLDTHITDITNVILWEDLHDVVLVGHSYGGMVITGVADRIPSRIKCLIYLDAFLPENGESVLTAGGGVLDLTTDKNGYWLYAGFPTRIQPLPYDVPMPPKTFSQAIVLKNQDAAKHIPTTYVQFTPRFTVFDRRAQALGWNLMTLDSDHNAQWSHPEELAALLEKATAMMEAKMQSKPKE